MKKALTLVLSVVLILCVLAGCGAVKGEPPFVREKKKVLPVVSLAQVLYDGAGVGHTITAAKKVQNFHGDVYFFIEGTYIDDNGEEALFETAVHGETGRPVLMRTNAENKKLQEYRLEGLEGDIYITGSCFETSELGDFMYKDGKFYGKDGKVHYTDDDWEDLRRMTARRDSSDSYYSSYKYAAYQIDPATVEEGLREAVGHTVVQKDIWYRGKK